MYLPKAPTSCYNWFTLQEDQGQTVTISYAYDAEGGAYRRTYDASDRHTSYEHGYLDWDLEEECANTSHAPNVIEWFPCQAPTPYPAHED